MKKIVSLLVIALFIWVTPAFALVRTRNVEAKDFGDGESGFKYKVAYVFATYDVTKSLSIEDVTVSFTAGTENNLTYAMPFKGRIVGVSIASSAALTDGSATVDVTINNQVTGVRTALDFGPSTRHYQSGLVAAHSQYNAQTLDWDDYSPPNWGGGYHDDDYLYGKATDLEVGDRLGVKLTTTSDYRHGSTNDLVITVIVLQ